MKKHYFIVYECKRYGWKPERLGGTSTGSNISKNQHLTELHPLQWQIEQNEKYGKQHEVGGGYTAREEYLVLNWIEISEEEYFKFLGHIG